MHQKTVVILHGIHGKPGIFWQQWLADRATQEQSNVVMVHFPTPESPVREEWKNAIEQAVKGYEHSSLWLVGHSLGVPAGLDYLETLAATEPIAGFVSVGGFYEPYGLDLNEEFMQEKTIDISRVKRNVVNRYVIRSLNDPYVDQAALRNLAEDFEANDFVIRNGQHFQHGSYIKSFPLLASILYDMHR